VDLKRPVGHRRGHRRIHDRHLAGVGISYLGFRIRRLRPFLKGEPIVLVEKGKIITASCGASGSPSTIWPRRRG
jgi:hypothetical protein